MNAPESHIAQKAALLEAAIGATSRDQAYVLGVCTAQIRVLAEAIKTAAATYEKTGKADGLESNAVALAAACTVLARALP